jgi:transposase, IS30 family
MWKRSKVGRMTGADRLEIVRRVALGESPAEAARAVGCSQATLHRLKVQHGGLASRTRARSPLRLSVAEREEVSRGLLAGDSRRAIARRLGRAPSTVSREVARATRQGSREAYRAWHGEEAAARGARRPKPGKLATCARLRQEVEARLGRHWSPQQIAASLKRDFPQEPALHVSHETIYRCLFVQARGGLRKELTAHLRTQRTHRHGSRRTDVTGQLADRILLSARPAEAEDRAVPGHWEGDLIIGKAGKSAIGTLVERTSRYVMLLHLPEGRTAEHVRAALTHTVTRLPQHLRRSLTWDQGKEMAEHVRFTVDTQVQVYFCDPHSPWQRGSNENTNGLLRQYFPKGMDLSHLSTEHLDAVAAELNGRPRQTLGWSSPADVFAQAVAMSA